MEPISKAEEARRLKIVLDGDVNEMGVRLNERHRLEKQGKILEIL